MSRDPSLCESSLSAPKAISHFDLPTAHDILVSEIAKLQVMRCSIVAKPYELENNAAYIQQLCKLVANHIEVVMADAGSSLTCANIDETYAHAIHDDGADCAAQLSKAAWAMESAA